MSDSDSKEAPIEEENVIELKGEEGVEEATEEETFVKIDLKNGLEELKEAQKGGKLTDIRAAYSSLTKSFPTAVICLFLIIVFKLYIFLMCLIEYYLVQLGPNGVYKWEFR